jgi:hypothetical protein
LRIEGARKVPIGTNRKIAATLKVNVHDQKLME